MFVKTGSLDPHGAPILRSEIITNSVVVTVNDAINVASGFAALGTTGALVYGHVTSITSAEGVGLTDNGASGDFHGTFTAASDNQTVAKNRVTCDVSKETLYSAEMDVAIGTTTGSDLSMYGLDLADEDTLDESTAHATTSLQYQTHGVDPLNTAKAIVNVYESQVFGV